MGITFVNKLCLLLIAICFRCSQQNWRMLAINYHLTLSVGPFVNLFISLQVPRIVLNLDFSVNSLLLPTQVR